MHINELMELMQAYRLSSCHKVSAHKMIAGIYHYIKWNNGLDLKEAKFRHQTIYIMTDLEKALIVLPNLSHSQRKLFSNFRYNKIYLLSKESVPKATVFLFALMFHQFT